LSNLKVIGDDTDLLASIAATVSPSLAAIDENVSPVGFGKLLELPDAPFHQPSSEANGTNLILPIFNVFRNAVT